MTSTPLVVCLVHRRSLRLTTSVVALSLTIYSLSAHAQSGPQPSGLEEPERAVFLNRRTTAHPLQTAPAEPVEPDDVRRRSGVTLAAGGGASFGLLGAPTWHVGSLRLGVQFRSPFAVYLQSSLLLGVITTPSQGGTLVAIHNSILAEISIQNYIQIGVGPSVDLLMQPGCLGLACLLSTVLWPGLHQRIAFPLISNPPFGATVGARGPARAINLAVDFHENLPANQFMLTATVGLGLDWY